MNVSQMFRAVSEGRVVTMGGCAWSCPECGAKLGQSREARDRRALAHCLLHRRPQRSVGSSSRPPSVLRLLEIGADVRADPL